MIKTVAFLSRDQVENRLKPSADTAIISITDPITGPSNRAARISREFLALTRLSFHDLYEENLGEVVGALPDLHANHKNGVRLFYSGFEICDYNDAVKIFEFTEKMNQTGKDVHLVVHCEAGVSRSAAVAKFTSEHYNVPIDQANDDTSAHNRRLFRLLHKAAYSKELITTGVIIETAADRKHWDSEMQNVSRPLGLF